jgi:hypothetical protein
MRKKNSTVLVIVSCCVLMLAVNSVRASTVILLNTTDKSFLPSLIAESRQLCGTLPDGERVTIYRLGQGWTPAFDYELNASSRITLGQTLNSTYAVHGHPDWVAALSTATTVARNTGIARVYIFTADLNSATTKGRYHGMTLLDLLRDKKLTPDDVRYFIRYVRNVQVSVDRDNIKLLADSTKWSQISSVPPNATASLPEPTPQTEPTKTTLRRWLYLTPVTITLLALAFFLVARIVRSRQRASQRGAIARMSRATPLDGSQNGPASTIHRIILLGRAGDSPNVLGEGEELYIGDSYKARPSFAANGCYVAITQNNGVLEIENPSYRSALIGSFELAPGHRYPVPLPYFEMRIGNEKVAVTRDMKAPESAKAIIDDKKREVFNHD